MTTYAGGKKVSFHGINVNVKEVISALQNFILRQKKVFESSKKHPASFLQPKDLRVSLKLSE